jgi:hypothetical protein
MGNPYFFANQLTSLVLGINLTFVLDGYEGKTEFALSLPPDVPMLNGGYFVGEEEGVGVVLRHDIT